MNIGKKNTKNTKSKMEIKALKTHFFDSLKNIQDEQEIESFFFILTEYLHNLKRVDLALNPNFELSDAEVEKWNTILADLQQEKPIQYITGEAWFYGLRFEVNENTLIPRPDTETLVETVLNLAKNRFNLAHSLRLLDLGTGSGCIAISLAAEQPNWQVTATDFSTQALAVAQHNAQQIGTANVEFYQGSWFQALPDDMPKFDIIVSNPPYIDSDDEHLPALTAEPITALVAANHGLADIEVIVQGSGARLNAQGLLAIEHGYDQGDAVQQIFRQYSFTDVTTLKDFGGNDRVTYGFFNQIS